MTEEEEEEEEEEERAGVGAHAASEGPLARLGFGFRLRARAVGAIPRQGALESLAQQLCARINMKHEVFQDETTTRLDPAEQHVEKQIIGKKKGIRWAEERLTSTLRWSRRRGYSAGGVDLALGLGRGCGCLATRR